MHIQFSWNFHQNLLTLTIYFIALNVAIEFVLIIVRTLYTMSLLYVACHALFYSFNKDGKLESTSYFPTLVGKVFSQSPLPPSCGQLTAALLSVILLTPPL